MEGWSVVSAGSPGQRCRCMFSAAACAELMLRAERCWEGHIPGWQNSIATLSFLTGAKGESGLSLLAGLSRLRNDILCCQNSAWGNCGMPKSVVKST